jgi:ferredoxin
MLTPDTMPTIEFLPNRLGPAVRVEAEGPIVDVCDDARAPVDFSCRSASCGTCRVAVLTGAELLEPPREDELEVLRLFEAGDGERLACQAKARPGPGLVRLRWIDE